MSSTQLETAQVTLCLISSSCPLLKVPFLVDLSFCGSVAKETGEIIICSANISLRSEILQRFPELISGELLPRQRVGHIGSICY